jgi:hypothetical protein
MKKILYYVVEKQLEDIGDIQETNGLKYVTVYSIENDKPKKEFVIEIDISDCSQQAINAYLDDNGMGDDEFELIEL